MKLVFKTLALLWSTKFLNISFTSKFLKTHKAFEVDSKFAGIILGIKKMLLYWVSRFVEQWERQTESTQTRPNLLVQKRCAKDGE